MLLLSWHDNAPFLDQLLLVGGEVDPNPGQHVGELFSGQDARPVLVHLSETPPETLDLKTRTQVGEVFFLRPLI